MRQQTSTEEDKELRGPPLQLSIERDQEVNPSQFWARAGSTCRRDCGIRFYGRTYASVLWRMFADVSKLTGNIISMLRQNWYTQNCIGHYFKRHIAGMADATGVRQEFIVALAFAVMNDAKVLIGQLSELPPDWQQAIQNEIDAVRHIPDDLGSS